MKQSASDSPRPGRRTTRRIGAPSGPRQADRRRAALIKAAGKLFREKGYDATTMDEIAAAAGFAKGTLYHYFVNKAELLQVLREEFEHAVIRRVRSRVEDCADDDWWGRIKAWIDAAAETYFEMNELHDVVFYGLGMPFRHAMAEAEINQYLAKLIRAGTDAGAWQVDDEQWTAVIMFYAFRGGCDEAIVGARSRADVPGKLNELFRRILGGAA